MKFKRSSFDHSIPENMAIMMFMSSIRKFVIDFDLLMSNSNSFIFNN